MVFDKKLLQQLNRVYCSDLQRIAKSSFPLLLFEDGKN